MAPLVVCNGCGFASNFLHSCGRRMIHVSSTTSTAIIVSGFRRRVLNNTHFHFCDVVVRVVLDLGVFLCWRFIHGH